MLISENINSLIYEIEQIHIEEATFTSDVRNTAKAVKRAVIGGTKSATRGIRKDYAYHKANPGGSMTNIIDWRQNRQNRLADDKARINMRRASSINRSRIKSRDIDNQIDQNRYHLANQSHNYDKLRDSYHRGEITGSQYAALGNSGVKDLTKMKHEIDPTNNFAGNLVHKKQKLQRNIDDKYRALIT